MDSLEKMLEKDLEDSVRIDVLSQLGYMLRRNDPQQGVLYAKEALSLAEQISYKKGRRDALYALGANQYLSGDNYSALETFGQVLPLSLALEDSFEISRCYHALGTIYRINGDFDKSLENMLSALKIREQIGDSAGIAMTLTGIGNMKLDLGADEEAVEAILQALKIREDLNDLHGLSGSHLSLGNLYLERYQFDAAIDQYEKVLEIATKIGDARTAGLATENIGAAYASQEIYTSALDYYTQSLQIHKAVNSPDGIARASIWIAGIHVRQGNYNLAVPLLDLSIELGEQMGNYQRLNQSYEVYYALDSGRRDFPAALEHYKLFIETRDSILNIKTSESLVKQEMEYEFEKRQALARVEQEAQNAINEKELEQQKLLRNFFIGGFILALAFLGMLLRQSTRIRKEKQRSDDLLLNILPNEIAEELKTNGKSQARQYKDVTVMFTDFKDFTRISGELSAEDLVAEIDNFFKAFDHIISKYSIEKIKTIGDSYMCAAGLPKESHHHASDLVSAALEMRRFVQQYMDKFSGAKHMNFEIRIGIHTGPVVAGIVGVKKFQYDIWGDTVNIASRMETNGQEGRVNISESTYNQVKENPKFRFENRGRIDVAGKGKMNMFFVEEA
jgi:class 3 adenylate cyclase